MCFGNLEFGEWKTRNIKMPSPGTTFLKRRLKWSPEGLHCPLYSWQHLLVYKITTENILDGLTLLLEPKMGMNSPTLRFLKGYDPRPVSRENRAICHIRISLFLLRVLPSVYIFKMLEGFSKGTAFLHFQSVLLVDLPARICDQPFSLCDGRYVLSGGSTTGYFPETAANLRERALRKMSNAERDFHGIRPKLQCFMKINWAWMSLSLNGECFCEQKKCLPIAYPCPAGGSSLLGLSTLCREFGVKPHQPENCISPG